MPNCGATVGRVLRNELAFESQPRARTAASAQRSVSSPEGTARRGTPEMYAVLDTRRTPHSLERVHYRS